MTTKDILLLLFGALLSAIPTWLFSKWYYHRTYRIRNLRIKARRLPSNADLSNSAIVISNTTRAKLAALVSKYGQEVDIWNIVITNTSDQIIKPEDLNSVLKINISGETQLIDAVCDAEDTTGSRVTLRDSVLKVEFKRLKRRARIVIDVITEKGSDISFSTDNFLNGASDVMSVMNVQTYTPAPPSTRNDPIDLITILLVLTPLFALWYGPSLADYLSGITFIRTFICQDSLSLASRLFFFRWGFTACLAIVTGTITTKIIRKYLWRRFVRPYILWIENQ